jgi:hypothetical protein
MTDYYEDALQRYHAYRALERESMNDNPEADKDLNLYLRQELPDGRLLYWATRNAEWLEINKED